jgi:XisI protein
VVKEAIDRLIRVMGKNGTEVGVANELVEFGVPKHDIVLAYHSPFMRQYDGFAVG